jgi:putative endonuclease
MKRKNLGLLGENLALKHLKSKGYKILQRNFHSIFGEIDIIGIEGGDLVFIEVKTRWSQSFGSPEEAIIPWKIKRIIRAGEYFQLLHPQLPQSLRLDAVVIELDDQGEPKRIEILKNLTG